MGCTTFLLGAGASANAIPVVSEFNVRFEVFIFTLEEHVNKYHHKDVSWESVNDFIKNVRRALGKFTTVDTYAYSLFKTNTRAYEAYKILLSYYLLFEQSNESEMMLNQIHNTWHNKVKLKIDQRYFPLIKAMESKANSSKKIAIVSWNYDSQLELAWAEMFGVSLEQSSIDLKVYPTMKGSSLTQAEGATCIKLNGTASIYYQSSTNNFSSIHDMLSPTSTVFLNSCYLRIADCLQKNGEIDSMMEYAWENEDEVRQARNRAKEIISETETLVVIGYSFPEYNIDIDRDLFSNRKNLDTIYYQVLPGDFDNMKEDFQRVIGPQEEIIKVSRTDRFYIDPIL